MLAHEAVCHGYEFNNIYNISLAIQGGFGLKFLCHIREVRTVKKASRII